MLSYTRRSTGLLAALALAVPGLLFAAGQTYVKQQNLAEMVAEADRIYRGTVLGVDAGATDVNGRSLPTTTFRIRVTELLKGSVDEQKGEVQIAELRVVGSEKKYLRVEGNMALLNNLPAPPQLRVGEDYLLFTNAPNSYGLSNTIGLAQGWFSISQQGTDEVCENSLNNLGLFRNMGGNRPAKGAIAYGELTDLIRAEIAGAGGQS